MLGALITGLRKTTRGWPSTGLTSFGSGMGTSRTLTPARLRVDDHARVEHARRVDRALRRPERLRERVGALLVVPGPVVAADGVVVGDRPARRDQRLRHRRLHGVPLLDLGAAPGR